MVHLPPSPFIQQDDGFRSETFDIHDVPANETMVEPEHPEGRKGDNLGLIATLGGLSVLVLGTWLIVFLNHPGQLGLFAAHPPLQTLAIAIFGAGILTLQPTSQPSTKARGLKRHQLIMLCVAFPVILTGTILVLFHKVIHEHNHFTSWHGTFGGIAFVWIIIQILLGGLSIWFGGSAFGGGMKAKRVWKYHRASGYLLFPMLLLTAAVGGNYSNWASNAASLGVRILVYTIAPIVILLGIWSRARLSKMNFSN
ncbi:hypothetical protein BD410DRAFT_751529 [Rickenella mellea]|uniref:Cytochrome b561 domain-containing protein n=1 Tax=Rickenella mellea TaxID=50990 RepID=A0A4Y7PXZ3_9AGAM|nr:hypothetical protein BD410DRAFT_751529 [Rickenella mellea]